MNVDALADSTLDSLRWCEFRGLGRGIIDFPLGRSWYPTLFDCMDALRISQTPPAVKWKLDRHPTVHLACSHRSTLENGMSVRLLWEEGAPEVHLHIRYGMPNLQNGFKEMTRLIPIDRRPDILALLKEIQLQAEAAKHYQDREDDALQELSYEDWHELIESECEDVLRDSQ
jgi:hypothetical protein